MPDFDLFPDIEAIISSVVRDAVDAGVYSSIPRKPEYPLVLVKRLGGSPVRRQRLDMAEMQFDVYGNTKSEAFHLAQLVRQSILRAEGTTNTHRAEAAFVTAVQDSLGLTWLPDPSNPPKDRYTFGMRIFFHLERGEGFDSGFGDGFA